MKALELAEKLFEVSTRCDAHYSLDRTAAAELRRLAEVNAELLNALETISAQGVLIIYNGYPHWALTKNCKDRADDALIKAKEQQ